MLAKTRQLTDMMNLVDDRRLALSTLDREMDHRMEKILERKINSLGTLSGKLDALSPLSVLKRGYGAVFHETGKTVSSAKELHPGDHITLRLADGSAKAEICEVE